MMDYNQESQDESQIIISEVRSMSSPPESGTTAYGSYLMLEFHKSNMKMLNKINAEKEFMKQEHKQEIQKKDNEIVQWRDLAASSKQELTTAKCAFNQTMEVKDAQLAEIKAALATAEANVAKEKEHNDRVRKVWKTSGAFLEKFTINAEEFCNIFPIMAGNMQEALGEANVAEKLQGNGSTTQVSTVSNISEPSHDTSSSSSRTRGNVVTEHVSHEEAVKSKSSRPSRPIRTYGKKAKIDTDDGSGGCTFLSSTDAGGLERSRRSAMVSASTKQTQHKELLVNLAPVRKVCIHFVFNISIWHFKMHDMPV